jgi:hypothetical protein
VEERGPLLEYRQSAPTKRPYPYSAVEAFTLCAPGATGFVLYFLNIASLSVLLLVLFVAIASAVISLILYGMHPKRALPWYVIVNLAINILGLLFVTLMVIALI